MTPDSRGVAWLMRRAVDPIKNSVYQRAQYRAARGTVAGRGLSKNMQTFFRLTVVLGCADGALIFAENASVYPAYLRRADKARFCAAIRHNGTRAG